MYHFWDVLLRDFRSPFVARDLILANPTKNSNWNQIFELVQNCGGELNIKDLWQSYPRAVLPQSALLRFRTENEYLAENQTATRYFTLSFNLPAAADRASLFQDLAGFGLDRSAAEPYAVEFDEAHYLSIYPDAQRLISCGDFKSAEDHWLQCGRYKYNEFRYRLLPNTDFSIHTEFMNSKPVTTFGLIASFSALNRKHWKPFLLSILRQSYPNWSVIALCAGDVSCKAELAAIVAELGLSELVVLRKIGDLSLSDILKTTTADFLAFMDPVNFITPDGLYRCAQFEQSAATLPAFYTDEVLVRRDGKIEGFFLKPKWSPPISFVLRDIAVD